MIQEIKRIKPLMTFEVITEEFKVLHIKAQSYEASGQYITFYQAVSSFETVEKEDIDKNTGEVIKNKQDVVIKKKIPFITLKNVYKISLINIMDEFELIKEMGEIIIPQKVEHIKIEKEENQAPHNLFKDEKIKHFISNREENIENNETKYKNDENKKTDNFEYDNFSYNHDNENIVNNQYNNDDEEFLNQLLNSNEDDFSISIEENNNQEMSDEELEALLNGMDNNDNNNKSMDIDDFLSIKTNEDDNRNKDFKRTADNILNIVEQRQKDYSSSETYSEEEDEKKKIIKEELNEYLKRTTTHFRSEPFFKFIKDRISKNINITIDDIVIQVCNMIKNREIDYQKFYNKSIQELISKNKDTIQYNFDGNLNNLLNIIQRRNEETRKITLIDLVVYLRKSNYFR